MGAEAAELTTDEGLSGDAFDLAFEAVATGEIVEQAKDEPVKDEPVKDEPAKDEPVKDEPAKDEPVKDEPVKDAPVKDAPVKDDPVKETPKKVETPDPAIEAAAKAAQEAATARENLSEDETKLLSEVATDFPEVLKAIEARERVLVAKMENQFAAKLAELTSQFDTKITPALTTAQSYATNQFMASVLQKHADAVTLLPDVEKWVAGQPAIVRRSYDAVLDGGTVAETVELLDIFKKATQVSTPPEPTPEEVAAQQDKEKRLKAQEGVKGRHTSGGRAAVDPDDFDGAFDKFAATA